MLQNHISLFQIICVRQTQAVAVAVEEELLEQRRVLAAARGLALRHLPREPIEMVGTLSGLPLGRAESINEDIDQRRRASRRNL